MWLIRGVGSNLDMLGINLNSLIGRVREYIFPLGGQHAAFQRNDLCLQAQIHPARAEKCALGFVALPANW
jgi:hypothetical protein